MSSEEGSGGTGGAEAREHPAHERTLLAWIRTGVGLISFGLVVERIGAQIGPAGVSAAFGVALAVLGCLTLVMGTVQFLRSRRDISAGTFVPAAAAYLVVVAGSLALAGVFIIYVVLTDFSSGTGMLRGLASSLLLGTRYAANRCVCWYRDGADCPDHGR